MGYEYSEPPINKNGKYYFGWRSVNVEGEDYEGYCPYYFEDQTVQEYDMDINVNNTPTITSPITDNGYYKFDGNTLISGSPSDYNLNVNVNPITVIDKIVFGDNGGVIASNDINSNWTFYGDVTSDHHSISVNNNDEILIIGKVYTDYRVRYQIRFYWNITGSTISIPDNCWVYKYNKAGTYSSYFYFYSMNSEYFGIGDSSGGDKNFSIILLRPSKFNFNGISWMTFD